MTLVIVAVLLGAVAAAVAVVMVLYARELGLYEAFLRNRPLSSP